MVGVGRPYAVSLPAGELALEGIRIEVGFIQDRGGRGLESAVHNLASTV